MRFVVVCVLAACRFEHGERPSDAAQGGDADAPVDMRSGDGDGGTGFVALHVPAASSTPGSAAITIASNQTIDTDARTIGGAPPPSGVTFDLVTQVPSGPQLAVLHVSTFTIDTAITARVVGTHPLVVIASGNIVVDGLLDAGANLDQYGAGGGAPQAGDRPGGQGAHAATYCDAGGGGGGHATAAGLGGGASGTGSVSGETCSAAGGTAGGSAGDMPITVLAGGSGGGPGRGGTAGNVAQCVASGGAGGGAVQLSSATAIRITGGINAGGGGGQGGVGNDNTNCTNRGSGAGGGSAGSIVLQSPSITVLTGAFVVAQGGGGGGGADVGTNGGNGGNGGISVGTPGASGGSYGSVGGVGGGNGAPTPGSSNNGGDGNGAGGGGAAGRIALYRSASGTASVAGTVLPSPFNGTYQ